MTRPEPSVVVVGFVFATIAAVRADLYTYDPNWPVWSSCPGASSVSLISAVAVDAAAGEVYVGQRSPSYDPIIVFDAKTGLFVRSWGGSGLVTTVHGLRVQPAEYSPTGNSTVWVTDIGDHTVKQFTTGADGSPVRVLTTLGTPFQNGSGVAPIEFGEVADITFGDDGRVYISDGDEGQNHRISCFAPPYSGSNAAWVFGRFGTSMNDFASPHSIAMDQMQRLWVVDRDNNRTQLFGQAPTATGPIWLGRWTCFKPGVPWGVAVWQSMSWMITADGVESSILISDIESDRAENHCNVLFRASVDIGDGGQVHLLDVDQKTGNIYVAVVGLAPNTFVRRFLYTP